MKQVFVLFWCLAGLVTLDVALRAPPRPAPPRATPVADTLSMVTAIRTTCELPAGTLVFVMTERGGQP